MKQGKLYQKIAELDVWDVVEPDYEQTLSRKDEKIDEVLDEAKQTCPLNPIIEVMGLITHPQEKKDYFRNCNTQRFLEETIAWFLENFGGVEP